MVGRWNFLLSPAQFFQEQPVNFNDRLTFFPSEELHPKPVTTVSPQEHAIPKDLQETLDIFRRGKTSWGLMLGHFIEPQEVALDV